jgi:signal transduction histidine kinase
MTHDRAGLQFSIRDTGIGIALEEQEGLFQEFQQAHTSGRQLYGGTGLGLAVSKHRDFDGWHDQSEEHARGGHNHHLSCLL